jgi:transcriptional regulator with XRE-family HTH domain
VIITLTTRSEVSAATTTPIAVSRALHQLGEHVATWRKLQGLSTTILAERAGIARGTLRAIEHGAGTASCEGLVRVLRVLGVMDRVVDAADPYSTDVGKLRADEVLPNRVRR